jgi:hypothetical protein
MDDLERFGREFALDVNTLGCDVFTRRHYPEIPKSREYPIDAVIRQTGVDYFTCTVAYMLAHAIVEGYEEIVLHGMYHNTDSREYMIHKPCMEFWIGMALGMGRQLRISGETALCKPFVWQTPRYGYHPLTDGEIRAQRIMAAAYLAALGEARPLVGDQAAPTQKAG